MVVVGAVVPSPKPVAGLVVGAPNVRPPVAGAVVAGFAPNSPPVGADVCRVDVKLPNAGGAELCGAPNDNDGAADVLKQESF